ncbi:MAG: Holliday junction branch migration protein RuvA [Bacteroidetes bacterium CG12_big_fil_rev_8_21_14_0_65_60_17]|nr:MAG: Holliday junction branch migration protein RuvA [Bacteroidetes bacterium CG12_big_fil_rev_8_21_14_0_65_60_17]
MIAYISGTLALKKPTEAIIEAGGIGYRVFIPTSTFEALPATGKATRLTTYHAVRDDAEDLFGFASTAEYDVFSLMIGVSGVGPKLALAALSAMSPAEIQRRIVDGDHAMLTRIPGVGKKTAQRMVLELRDRMAALDGDAGAGASPEPDMAHDALAALQALGLSQAAAVKALRSVREKYPDAVNAEDLIRLALRE